MEKKHKNDKLIFTIKSCLHKFIKFYGLRAALGLIGIIFKNRLNYSKYLLSDVMKALFNLNNLRTGLFLSLMPTIYKLLNIFFRNHSSKENEKLYTFISGFIASLIGILISEKAKIMNFIVMYALIRSLHSALVVFLKKKGCETHNKIITWIAFASCLFAILMMAFYYPSFHKTKNLVDSWAQFKKNEANEVSYLRQFAKN